MVELTGFNGVPHLKCPVVTEMGKVVGTLRLVLKEMEDRYQRFSMLGVRNSTATTCDVRRIPRSRNCRIWS